MSSKPELLIEVYTDPMCPWCWVGGTRLSKTLASTDFQEQILPYMTPMVKMMPYILDPRLPSTSSNRPGDVYDAIEKTSWSDGKVPTKKTYYSGKFLGDVDGFDAKIGPQAKELGLPPFDWTSDGKVGATWDAHRLLSYAWTLEDPAVSNSDATTGVQHRLIDRLYEDFHAKSCDLSDRAYLATVASDIGIFSNDTQAAEWLQGDQQEDQLKRELRVAEMNGVQSVPFIVLNVSHIAASNILVAITETRCKTQKDGADHMSQVGTHDTYMRMFRMAASLHGGPS